MSAGRNLNSTEPAVSSRAGLGVLFNTLAYAQFFAFVFGVAWVLANRRLVLLLPWFMTAGYALYRPLSPSSVLVTLSALGLSLMLCKRVTSPTQPAWSLAATSVAINLLGCAFLSLRHGGADPLSLGLLALKVPLPQFEARTLVGLALTLMLGTLLVRAKKVRLLFILGASYIFYAHWDYRFLPLIWGSSTVDWLLGHAIARASSKQRRKLWLIGTVFVNLGVLAIFKYYNFGVDSAVALLKSFDVSVAPRTLEIALPVGISFFTFESMSYVIDVYRGHIKPQKSYFEYLAFVAFFPHLVAGPIVRPRDLLPQLAGPPRFNSKEGSEGLFLIALGLLKKVAIGDYLALNLIDRVFDSPLSYSALENYAAVLGYAVQIYCDFSGYTDIAIGSALLLGVRFPLNFNAPYKASNIQDFWRRWHISLSTWLRDYLYISLGGNRRGQSRTYFNLMVTMLLGGLWHGANWTFVVWGGIHGAALAVTRAYTEKRKATRRKRSISPLRTGVAVFSTFHLVCAAWIFFRADSFGHAALVFSRLGTLSSYHPNLPGSVILVLALGLLSHFTPERWYQKAQRVFIEAPVPAQAAWLGCIALILKEMATSDAVPFVYFQF